MQKFCYDGLQIYGLEPTDSRPGTLMLTDCVDLCRANATCQAGGHHLGSSLGPVRQAVISWGHL
jgi:hypothetical protein